MGPDSDSTMTTQAGIRFIAPRIPGNIPILDRLQFFANVGMNHLAGAVGLGPVLAVKVQPGVRVYLHDRWGLEFRTPPWHVHEVVKAGNPYDRHSTRAHRPVRKVVETSGSTVLRKDDGTPETVHSARSFARLQRMSLTNMAADGSLTVKYVGVLSPR